MEQATKKIKLPANRFPLNPIKTDFTPIVEEQHVKTEAF